jgi:ketosteroid isomerase-like protein
MADNADVDVVKRGYEAFNRGDVETLGALFTDDAVQHVPGNSQISGEKKGRDSILAYYGQVAQLTDGSFTAELESATPDGSGKVVAKHHAQGKRGDKILDSHDTLVFTLEDGKFAKLDESTEDQAATDAFWG